jgi:hypothetical protein
MGVILTADPQGRGDSVRGFDARTRYRMVRGFPRRNDGPLALGLWPGQCGGFLDTPLRGGLE